MKMQQLNASWLRVFRVELQNEGAAHTASRRPEWVSRQPTRHESVPPFLTASPNSTRNPHFVHRPVGAQRQGDEGRFPGGVGVDQPHELGVRDLASATEKTQA